jgi:hypothetical protein
MLQPVGVWVQLVATLQQIPSLLHHSNFLVLLQLLLPLCALVLQRVLRHLRGIEGVVGKAQYAGVRLLLPDEELPKVNWAGDGRGIAMINSHPVEVPIVGYAPHVLDFGGVGEKTHALEPAVAEGLVDRDSDLVGSELIENRTEEVHAGIFPESSFMVEDLVAEDVGDGGQLVIRAVFGEGE